jgi:Na+-driven multidrug efflux pump
LFAFVLSLLAKDGYAVRNGKKASFAWTREFVKVGGISGLESFVRNAAYMLMVSRMVNMVGEQGTYWVANNFIWGWMLLPVTQLGELIKQETAADERAVRNNSLGYFTITGAICLLWIVLIPAYKPFMRSVLGFGDTDKLFELVMVLFVFYIFYAFQNVFDMTFYGRGKTNYMLFESVVTNSVYYGACFVLWRMGVWVPTLSGIALMFGIGNAFDSIVSGAVYARYLKKNHISILNVD